MSEKLSSPTGQHVVTVDKKDYVFKLTHMRVAVAEQLLGTGLLQYQGGGINYNLILGLAMLDGQHGIKTREDVADLLDQDGIAKKFDEAILNSVLDFFRANYPDLAETLKQVEKRAKNRAS